MKNRLEFERDLESIFKQEISNEEMLTQMYIYYQNQLIQSKTLKKINSAILRDYLDMIDNGDTSLAWAADKLNSISAFDFNDAKVYTDFDGDYLCIVSEKMECGNEIIKYKVIENSNNTWFLPKNVSLLKWAILPELSKEARNGK